MDKKQMLYPCLCEPKFSLESGHVRKQVIYEIHLQSQLYKMLKCSRTILFHETGKSYLNL